MSRIALSLTALAVLLAAACGARQEKFRPTEKPTAQSPKGYTAAEYDLSTEESDLGEAKVWSDGAYRKEIRGDVHTVVHVGFEFENHTSKPLRLNTEDLLLDSATLDREVLRDIKPALIDGMTTIAAQEEERLHAYFALPRGVKPEQVDAFRVKWKIRTNGLSYTQKTPFVESQEEEYATVYYYTPFYDPFIYDPFIWHPEVMVYHRPYRHYHIYRSYH